MENVIDREPGWNKEKLSRKLVEEVVAQVNCQDFNGTLVCVSVDQLLSGELSDRQKAAVLFVLAELSPTKRKNYFSVTAALKDF